MLKDLRQEVRALQAELYAQQQSSSRRSLPPDHFERPMDLRKHSRERLDNDQSEMMSWAEPKSPRSEAGWSEPSFSARSTGTWSAFGEEAEVMKAEVKKVQ